MASAAALDLTTLFERISSSDNSTKAGPRNREHSVIPRSAAVRLHKLKHLGFRGASCVSAPTLPRTFRRDVGESRLRVPQLVVVVGLHAYIVGVCGMVQCLVSLWDL